MVFHVLKRKDFARWQQSEGLSDRSLCDAVAEMERGLIDADLGGWLFKKRIARSGAGKSGGYRTLLSARVGHRYVFLLGFAKSERANISQQEKKALQFAGRVFLELSGCAMHAALTAGVLQGVECEQNHQVAAARYGHPSTCRRNKQNYHAPVRRNLSCACA